MLLTRGTEDELFEAETWCPRLTDRGDMGMRAALGATAVRRGKYDQAVLLWWQAADGGDAAAALSLAPVEAV